MGSGLEVLGPVTYSGIEAGIDNMIADGIGNWIGVKPPDYVSLDDPDSCSERAIRGRIPTVSGIETAQAFMDQVAIRHCINSFGWENQCGSYTPQTAPPFEMAGHPTNDLGFWQRFRGNIEQMGCEIGDDFRTRPWSNKGVGTTAWSGDSYNCQVTDEYGGHAVSGKHAIPAHPSGAFYYGRMLRDDFETFIPSYGTTTMSLYNYGYMDNRKSLRFSGQLYSESLVLAGTDSDEVALPEKGTSGLNFGELNFAIKTSSGIWESPSGQIVLTSGYTTWIPVTTPYVSVSGTIRYEAELEYYNAGSVLDVTPVTNWLYGFGGDFDTASGAFPNGSLSSHFFQHGEVFEETSAPQNPYDPLTLLEIQAAEYLTQTKGGPTEISFMQTSKPPQCSYWQPRSINGSMALSNHSRHQIYIMPLKGKCGNVTSFRQRTGIIPNSGFHARHEVNPNPKSLVNPGNSGPWTADFRRYVGGKLRGVYLEQEDVHFPDFIAHGGLFATVEDMIDYIRDGNYNEIMRYTPIPYWESGQYGNDLLDNKHIGWDVAWSGEQKEYPVPSMFEGCSNSGDNFLALIFHHDYTACSGALSASASSIDVSNPSHIRGRFKLTASPCIPVIRHTVFGGSSSYSGLLPGGADFTTPWTDWIYPQQNILSSSVGMNFFGRTFTLGPSLALGTSNLAGIPATPRLDSSFGTMSGIPVPVLNIGGASIPTEPAVLMHSGDTPITFFTI